MKLVDEAIFLFRTNYSETSLIATYYTKEHGLQKFMFKGGKKKSAVLFPLSIAEITFYGRHESSLKNITNAVPALPLSFQFDPVRSMVAFFIAEVVRKCMIESDKDLSLFEFLKNQISKLDVTENLIVFPIEFMLFFANQIGIMPFIERGNQTEFQFSEGKITLGNTIKEDDKGIELLTEIIQNKTINIGDYSKHARQNALELMIKHYEYHVPKIGEFETYAIVKEVLA